MSLKICMMKLLLSGIQYFVCVHICTYRGGSWILDFVCVCRKDFEAFRLKENEAYGPVAKAQEKAL